MNYTAKKIERGTGRRFAVGDIHGCFFAFEELLNKEIKITKDDQLFLLGDLIDKGRNSALVLDLILDLKGKGFHIFPIKGNHEKQLLSAYDCGFEFFENYLLTYNSEDLLNGDLEKYLNLISSFEYCFELDHFVLSHCGINEQNLSPFTDLRGMFPKVNFHFDEELLLLKTQIHGHLVRTCDDIKKSVENKEKRFSVPLNIT